MFEIKFKNDAGFSLIELVTVMAIISIGVSVLTVSFTTTQRTKKNLETNARQFASVLKEAQNYALTGKQVNGVTPCKFKVSWSTSVYWLRPMSRNGVTGLCTDVISTTSYPLKGVAFYTADATGISFSPPLATSSVVGPVLLASFTRSGLRHAICLSAGNLITDKPGNVCP